MTKYFKVIKAPLTGKDSSIQWSKFNPRQEQISVTKFAKIEINQDITCQLYKAYSFVNLTLDQGSRVPRVPTMGTDQVLQVK